MKRGLHPSWWDFAAHYLTAELKLHSDAAPVLIYFPCEPEQHTTTTGPSSNQEVNKFSDLLSAALQKV